MLTRGGPAGDGSYTRPARSSGRGAPDRGLNVSDLGGEDVEADTELGFRGGGVLRYEFAPDGAFGFQTGLIYSRKGASGDGEEGLETDIDLDYLEVPVLLVANIPTDGAPIRPRLYGGGSLNFEVSCDVSASDGDTDVSADCDEGDVFERQTFDFGLRFGGGVDVEVSPSAAVTLDVGYDLGLTDIAEAETVEAKNRNLFFTGGVVFRP